MKKIVIILIITGFSQNIQCSYKSNEDLRQAIMKNLEQLIIDLEYVQISDQGESLPANQATLMDNYYKADQILHDQILKNIERKNFQDADNNALSYIAKDRKIIALIETGLDIMQAEDEVEKATIGEQAFAALLQDRAKIDRMLGGSFPDEKFHQNFIITETERLYKTVAFFDAGLKLSQAMIACNDKLTLDEALEMQSILWQRNGINGNNDGYQEIITHIKSKR